MPKNKTARAWQPSCSLQVMTLRAAMLAKIRGFFEQRKVLEVETPLLGNYIGTDPELDFFATNHPATGETLFLQTSPEYAMKRLLAAGSGSIYQICKSLRKGESGRFHNPEFTILEWYRIDYDLSQLMDETVSLLKTLLASALPINKVEKISYQAIFTKHTELDPVNASLNDFINYARLNDLPEAEQLCGDDLACWMDLLFSHRVQPALSPDTIYLVYGYPARLAALARLHPNNPKIAERFEVFINGIELGNGYCELTDAEEQSARFDRDIQIRKSRNNMSVQADQRLLAALKHGLPDCSGIAIGLDRVLMLLSGASHIDEVISFPIQRA